MQILLFIFGMYFLFQYINLIPAYLLKLNHIFGIVSMEIQFDMFGIVFL